MKQINPRRALSILFVSCLLSALAAAPALGADFCWKDSYGRGVGTIPTSCPSGTVQDPTGLLCYPACRAGYYMVGPVCWQSCPSGYVDTGAFCHYNKPLTTSGSWQCTSRDWFGTCWWWVLACPSGYTNAGTFCALNTPPIPAGWSGLSGLDLIKGSYGNGGGYIKNGCPTGKLNDAGLCYQACAAGNTGAGPVCWAAPPTNWVNCGMGAAKDSVTCGMTVFDQVMSVGNLAVDIATVGSGGMATSAAKLGKLAELKKAYAAAKQANATWAQAVDAAVKIKETAEQVYTGYQVLTTDAVPTTEDLVRLAATIASLTPVPIAGSAAGVVAAYTYPKCSVYFPPK
jgi:hypothetical protein